VGPDVDGHNAVPVGAGGRGEAKSGGDSGVERHSVQSPEHVSCVGEDPAGVAGVAGVTGDGVARATLGGDAVHGGLGGVLVDICDGDGRALAGRQEADGPADTSRRVGLAVGLLTAGHDEQPAAC